ncbi:UDP-glucose 4-epimerase GalE [Polynucleobacter acidiphobus]|uniref:UDP-glucose 4-epimerase GalE n=1 Tax=Polynucleobacter acidiphobus TaxID=556053 RepID=UPI000D39B0C7|nr:UDP-glucose 4-epimerase GalE [Polynucleobacter acidiphobus]
MTQTILVTGGLGYIGSHTVVKLLEQNYRVFILDNLCNSERSVHARITQITGKDSIFVEGDIRDRSLVTSIFQSHAIDGVIHFAGLKAVGESQAEPLRYYDNNVLGSIVLFEEMQTAGVKTLVFSSSATVYGDSPDTPYHEQLPLKPINVYGRTKWMIEQILADLALAQPQMAIACLRYFNPVGAHASGLIGEHPRGIPNNLMPYIAQVAIGERECLRVFGADYPTPDGTGLRDYIHVDDLAEGHLLALQALQSHAGLLTVNLGTGIPTSVLQMIAAFEAACGKPIAYEIVERRSGDSAKSFADPSLAKTLLGWQSQYGIERMCVDTWRFYQSLSKSL